MKSYNPPGLLRAYHGFYLVFVQSHGNWVNLLIYYLVYQMMQYVNVYMHMFKLKHCLSISMTAHIFLGVWYVLCSTSPWNSQTLRCPVIKFHGFSILAGSSFPSPIPNFPHAMYLQSNFYRRLHNTFGQLDHKKMMAEEVMMEVTYLTGMITNTWRWKQGLGPKQDAWAPAVGISVWLILQCQ